MRQTPELLAPAGSFETALAAFAAGADAVYLGLDAFSARAEAVNFSLADLSRLLAYARQQKPARKVYVTFNTLVNDDERESVLEKLALLEECRVDGIIVQDLGVAALVHRHFPALALHASTQLVTHNLEGVLALKERGFTRVVLARELPLEAIRTLAARGGIEIEVFIHGALCYSLSGLCLFSAIEKTRSGNRGRCAYCCRMPYTDAAGQTNHPFSMRDLRLDDTLGALADAGVASLKIEGRMKSPLYVASVVKHYRERLDDAAQNTTRADLETVFSRRTTTLYIDGAPSMRKGPSAQPGVIDPDMVGHVGTPVGTVKRITRDRENKAWLRFRTNRALERHDGLQFALARGKLAGFGIREMRTALSRKNVFSVPAGTDVEVRLPDDGTFDASACKSGATVYCSASNEMKRRFPQPVFRPGEVAAGRALDVRVTLSPQGLSLSARSPDDPALAVSLALPAALPPARRPEDSEQAVRRALAKLGETDWRLDTIVLDDPDGLFAAPALLNDARRRMVAALDAQAAQRRREKITAARETWETALPACTRIPPARVAKIRLDQPFPASDGPYDEIVVALSPFAPREAETALARHAPRAQLRLALPVFTHENDYALLRTQAKRLIRAGFSQWETSDLAGLRMLRQLGVSDITADWPLYAFNRAARLQLAQEGVWRYVASPEMDERARMQAAGAGASPHVECLVRQSTPLFISLTRPAADDPSSLTGAKGACFTSFYAQGLWITTYPKPRIFPHTSGATWRTDFSWDAPSV